MKKKVFAWTLFIMSVSMSFFAGKSQTKTVSPSIEDYIKCDSFETFYTDGNEVQIIANSGNEYVFTK